MRLPSWSWWKAGSARSTFAGHRILEGDPLGFSTDVRKMARVRGEFVKKEQIMTDRLIEGLPLTRC